MRRSTWRRLLVGVALVTGLARPLPAAGDELPAAAAEPGASTCPSGQVFPVDGVRTDLADLRRLAGLAGLAPLHAELFLRASSAPPLVLCADGPASHGLLAPTSWAEGNGLAVAFAPLRWQSVFNSAYPTARNTGALWAGRGRTTELQGGATVRWRFLTAGFRPVVAYQQNRAFVLSPYVREGYGAVTPGIDLPVRFGDRPFWTLDLGQSFVRADAFNVAVGISTENLWWGPGLRNSLILSNTAAGFPHLFVGTSRPVDIHVGLLEVQYVAGQLHESPYFDADPENDRRAMAALTLGFAPRFLPGLSLGAARVYNYSLVAGSTSWRDFAIPLVEPFLKEGVATPENPNGERPDNQLLALFGRWAFPEVGFEVYAEWARDDHNWDALDVAMDLGHSSVYLLGLQKALPVGPYWLRLNAELVHLVERPVLHAVRPTPTFYTHSVIRQGYTHGGQMLGAAVGPGSDSQFLAADLFYRSGRTGLFLERTLRNESVYYRSIPKTSPFYDHDLELTAGVRQAWAWQELDVSGELGLSRRWNRDFGGHDTNVSASLQLTWWPGRTQPPVLPAYGALRTQQSSPVSTVETPTAAL